MSRNVAKEARLQTLIQLIVKAREIDNADDQLHESINDIGSVGTFVESLYKPTLQTDVRLSEDGKGLDYTTEDSDTGETVQEGSIDFKDMPKYILDIIVSEVEAVLDKECEIEGIDE